MTTNTTKDPRPDIQFDAAIERPIASETAGVAVLPVPSERDLESRIKECRAELLGKLGELKTDRRSEAAESRDKLRARLSELAHILKWGIVDGWANPGDAVAHRLEQWLAASAQLATRNGQS